MKTIRNLAAFLLISTGIMHVISMIKAPEDPNATPMLIFGIVYFIIGVLLALNFKYAAILGIIFPL